MIRGDTYTRPQSLAELIEQLKTARDMRTMCAKGMEKVYDDNIHELLNSRYYKEEFVKKIPNKEFEEGYKEYLKKKEFHSIEEIEEEFFPNNKTKGYRLNKEESEVIDNLRKF